MRRAIKPFFTDDAITIYNGEACAVMAQLETGSFDALITDPPYSSGGQFRGDRAADPKAKYVSSNSGNQIALGTFNGDTRSELGHLYWCAAWIGEACRLVKPGGILGLFSDWRQITATVLALQAGGVVWRGILPWHKPASRPTQGRFANSCEYLVWGTNGARALDALGGRALPGLVTANPPRNRQHITQKPVEVMAAILKVVPEGGVVLDPFAGSGTTGRAAKDTGRRAVLVEMDRNYCEIAAKRLAQKVLL